MKRLLVVSAFALISTLPASLSSAQSNASISGDTVTESVVLPEPLTTDQVDALVSRMSDEDVRALLLQQLSANAVASDAAADQADLSEFFYHGTVGAFSTILGGFFGLPAAIQGQVQSVQAFNLQHGSVGWVQLLSMLGAAIVIGLAIEWLVNIFVGKRLPSPEIVSEPTLQQSLKFLAIRLVREVLGVFVFFVCARIAVNQMLSGDLLALGETFLFSLVLLPRVTYSAARFLLAPHHPAYRIVQTDDITARFLTRHPVALALVGGVMISLIEFNRQSFLQTGSVGLGFWLDLIFRLYLVYIIWRAWDGLQSMMLGTEADLNRYEERIARAYPAFAIASVFAMWWVLAIVISYGAPHLLEGRGDIVTLTLLMLAPAFDTLIRGLVNHLVPPMKGEGPVAETAYAATKVAYKRIGRVVILGITLLIIANAWGLTPEMLAGAGEALFDVSYAIVLGYLAWEVFSLFINRKLANELTTHGLTAAAASAGEVGGAGGTRLSTVLPLFLLIGRAAIFVVFGLIALSELGIDTTPLLAGAGIAGLAIGFGAQKLVTDVVSGAFFLIDDAFRMGEYVEMGETKGTVEKISIRSMQLRHHRGPVYTVPYGEIQFLKNYSRDWGIMKLPFIFPFDTDPERIRKIFKKIGQDLLQHPEFGDYFLEPFKSQGVISIDDVGMTIRGKFTAKPGKQWEMRKAIFTEVHKQLAEAGIPFARREVRVALPNLSAEEDLSEEDKAKIAGAASAAG